MKPLENATLAAGLGSGTSLARIHNDGKGLPTCGYGFNLANKAVTYAVIEKSYRYAINQVTGTPSDSQVTALGMLQEWKNGGESNYTNGDRIRWETLDWMGISQSTLKRNQE